MRRLRWAIMVALVFTSAIAPLSSQEIAHVASSATQCSATTLLSPPVRDLEPLLLRYQGTFTVAEKAMPITSTLAVSPHPAGGWAVVERALLPRGLAVDSARLEARSLVPRERTVAQGTLRITLALSDQRARITLASGGQPREVDAELCGPLFGDGAGSFVVLGRLPLATGYRATLRHLDVQSATTTLRQLVVVGSEQVTIPAGRFDTWMLELTEDRSAKPTTIWVDKLSLVPVRFLTSQGAVTIAMELVDSPLPRSSSP